MGDDVVQGTSTGMCGASSGPVSEAMAADILKEGQTTTIWDGGDITQGRVPGIEIPHVNHAGRRNSGERREINSTWSRINIAES